MDSVDKKRRIMPSSLVKNSVMDIFKKCRGDMFSTVHEMLPVNSKPIGDFNQNDAALAGHFEPLERFYQQVEEPLGSSLGFYLKEGTVALPVLDKVVERRGGNLDMYLEINGETPDCLPFIKKYLALWGKEVFQKRCWFSDDFFLHGPADAVRFAAEHLVDDIPELIRTIWIHNSDFVVTKNIDMLASMADQEGMADMLLHFVADHLAYHKINYDYDLFMDNKEFYHWVFDFIYKNTAPHILQKKLVRFIAFINDPRATAFLKRVVLRPTIFVMTDLVKAMVFARNRDLIEWYTGTRSAGVLPSVALRFVFVEFPTEEDAEYARWILQRTYRSNSVLTSMKNSDFVRRTIGELFTNDLEASMTVEMITDLYDRFARAKTTNTWHPFYIHAFDTYNAIPDASVAMAARQVDIETIRWLHSIGQINPARWATPILLDNLEITYYFHNHIGTRAAEPGRWFYMSCEERRHCFVIENMGPKMVELLRFLLTNGYRNQVVEQIQHFSDLKFKLAILDLVVEFRLYELCRSYRLHIPFHDLEAFHRVLDANIMDDGEIYLWMEMATSHDQIYHFRHLLDVLHKRDALGNVYVPNKRLIESAPLIRAYLTPSILS